MGTHADDRTALYAADDLWDCVSDLLTKGTAAGQVAVLGIPSAADPRALIVMEDRWSAARLVRRQFGAGGPRRRLKADAVAALIVTGLAARIPRLNPVVPVRRPRLGYQAWLHEKLPAGTRVAALLLGPPRANRKPVVLLANGSGHLVAVAKFGLNRVTCPLVRHEAKALEEVGSLLGGVVHLPRLMASGSVGRGEGLLMSPLADAVPGLRPTRETLVEVVRAVGAVDRRPGPNLDEVAEHPRLAPLRARINETRRSNEGVELGTYHGDLHPGNLAVAHDGRLILWDWERWGYGAPVGFDLLHHDLQSWITQDGMNPRAAADALVAEASGILEPLGVAASAAPSVARDYLIRLASRYAVDQQDRAGSALGNIEEWLFPAVLR